MINWRTIVGFIFLLVGIKQLYTINTVHDAAKINSTPFYAAAGCVVWMAVGVYFIIKGMTKRPD